MKRWAHFVSIAIFGHRELKNSSYSKQNHASLVRRFPEDQTQPIEQFIVEVMARSGQVILERQTSWYQWDASFRRDIRKTSTNDRPHLGVSQQQLYCKPYLQFVERYKLYTSYNIIDVPNGCQMWHTTSKGVFMTLLDDGRCQCQHRWAWKDPCKHKIANRIHKSQSAFCLDMFSPLSLFLPTLPKLKAPLENSNGERRIAMEGMNQDINPVPLSIDKLSKEI